jgi:hypothetical protein
MTHIYVLTFYWHEDVAIHDYINFLWTHLSGLVEDVPLSMHVLMWFQHNGSPPLYRYEVSVAVQKCSWMLNWSWTWSSSFLAYSLTRHISSLFFVGDVWKPRSAPVQLILDRNCGITFDNLQVKWTIHPESPDTCKFLFRAKLSCMSVNMEAMLSTSCKWVKVKRLLITHLFFFCVINNLC